MNSAGNFGYCRKVVKNDIMLEFSSWGNYALKRKVRYKMATSSITANFTISDPKAARAFATAFIRNSRKANTPAVMPWRMITSADVAKKGV